MKIIGSGVTALRVPPGLVRQLKRIDEVCAARGPGGGAGHRDGRWDALIVPEAHQALVLAGVPLDEEDVARLTNESLTPGKRPLADCLLAVGYANTLRWLLADGAAAGGQAAPAAEHLLQRIGSFLADPLTATGLARADSGAPTDPLGSALALRPPAGWADNLAAGPGALHPVVWATDLYGQLVTSSEPSPSPSPPPLRLLAPRLVLQHLLVRHGYPPALIRRSQRAPLRQALARQAAGDPMPLANLVVRALQESITRLAGPAPQPADDLVPLSTLAAGTPYTAGYLRCLAEQGRLQAVRRGRLWLSSRAWFFAYLSSRSPRGRRPR